MGKRVALVLGSGGARGYAHIGVIEELEARGYQISCIAGSSMGAVIGGIYAAGKLPVYRRWVETLDYLDVLRLLDVSFSLGAIRGDRIFGRIRAFLGEINIEDLPIPYTAVATDLTNQQEVWFQEGCLHQAMRASAAIPSLFTPVVQGSRVLVDGGLLNPIPIVPVVSSRCDLIVAVNVNASNQVQYELPVIERPPAMRNRLDQMMGSIGALGARLAFRRRGDSEFPALLATAAEFAPAGSPHGVASFKASHTHVVENEAPDSVLEMINQSFDVMQNSLAQYKIAGYPPDILVNVPKRVCRFFEFYKAPELIALGRQIASDSLDKYEQHHPS
ncbi:patatin-like phospholipase family protein [Pseudomonas sp. MAP12]|uniref:Patatin-like phospholipase family protein n=1 Tax=Geopseudomonas aromaticivorans TaxID=2849492 RepID=A0ABS6MXE3_9GAMM|nr:patatin-like phospholipase family protein [Pseudomonas aromaticivorans]MBV2133054.1 patatin-like phospholipase family protein [Pseudomonas aromaticivorans]